MTLIFKSCFGLELSKTIGYSQIYVLKSSPLWKWLGFLVLGNVVPILLDSNFYEKTKFIFETF